MPQDRRPTPPNANEPYFRRTAVENTAFQGNTATERAIDLSLNDFDWLLWLFPAPQIIGTELACF
jgi:hypothetical protein